MASGGTAARRYAEAVFELAGRDEARERWLAELQLASEIVSAPDARRALASRSIPLDERSAALVRLLDGRVGDQVQNLARLLLQRENVALLPSVAREYERLRNLEQGIVEAVVTAAQPLTSDEEAAVRDTVATISGAPKVVIRTVIDPTLIGGLTVRIGDRLIDGSVRGRLERLRDQLVAEAR